MRDVAPLLQPRIVAVIGASATRQTQGNGVIRNLRLAGFAGRIVPVHPSAATVDGLDAVPGIEHLPPGVDTAVVAIPAPAVAGALPALERADVRSAVVFSNGFLPAAEAAFRAIAAASTMAIHGPNCMGLINITDGVRLYPSTVTAKVVPGRVALIAQSGSAAISLMNSTSVGLSKIITMGSEWQVTAPDYLAWLAQDAATDVIGVVLESIQRPADFATAAAAVRAAGKSLVVLKVGRSDVGAAAVQAHTGAMVSRAEAYDCFFARHGIATARDYDELIASVECLAGCRTRPAGGRIAIIGISGGETALACDMASESGLELARWSDATEAAIITALPGAAGVNPLDLGATPHHTVAQDDAAIAAILADAAVDQVMVVQDAQHTLTPTMLGNYTPRILSYGRHATRAGKPLVMVSPTAENTHSDIVAMMSESGIPVLRGLRPAMAALRNLALPPPSPALPAPQGREVAIPHNAGPLPTAETHRILAAYDIPLVRSALVNTAEQAIAASHSIGYPLAAKIASPDAPHRSEFGGVTLGIADEAALLAALDRMRHRLLAAIPAARIEGFELQEDLVGWVEAAAGFVVAPPFGALVMVGTGGVLVELAADRAVDLAPFPPHHAAALIARTRLARRLSGYRGLLPPTPIAALADLLARLSELAADHHGRLTECDLNPIMLQPATGAVRVVDALLIGA